MPTSHAGAGTEDALCRWQACAEGGPAQEAAICSWNRATSLPQMGCCARSSVPSVSTHLPLSRPVLSPGQLHTVLPTGWQVRLHTLGDANHVCGHVYM